MRSSATRTVFTILVFRARLFMTLVEVSIAKVGRATIFLTFIVISAHVKRSLVRIKTEISICANVHVSNFRIRATESVLSAIFIMVAFYVGTFIRFFITVSRFTFDVLVTVMINRFS